MQEKLRKTECLREDIVRLIEEQEQWKVIQKRIESEENEKITQYIREQEEQSKRYKQMEYERRLAINEQQEKMCAKLDEIEVINSDNHVTVPMSIDFLSISFSVKNWNVKHCSSI